MQLLIFLNTQQQLSFCSYEPSLPLRVVGSNGLFGIWLFHNQVAAPFALTLAGGGLKWTRTIDLTLIRRVL